MPNLIPLLASESSDKKCRAAGGGTRSGTAWFTLCMLIAYSSWAVYHYQYEVLPAPVGLSAVQDGENGFSEHEAMKHVRALTELGPRPVSSDALELGLEYVLEAAENIKRNAPPEVDVEVEFFRAKPGANRVDSGSFKGKSLLYSDINHVLLRISPKLVAGAGDNGILVSCHVDTVFSAEGAGDDTSNVAVMLELARGISQSALEFKKSVIFFFNTGEEEGLNGAHSFITQHPWNSTVSVAIDLEAMGIGGKSGIFQAGPETLAIQNFATAAKYPSGQIAAQDFFSAGALNSATDFQVYKEIGGLSGLDFAYTDQTPVYHTRNDKIELLKPGSLQHLGDNMLAFLIQSTGNEYKANAIIEQEKSSPDPAIYFDVLGKFMILYHQSFAKWLHTVVIVQTLLIWAAYLYMGGYTVALSLVISCVGIVLMWVLSIAPPLLVALSLPHMASSPVPYVASPWLVLGLFVAPSLLGALAAQNLVYNFLRKHLSNEYSETKQLWVDDSVDELAKVEAERWLFKSGFIQWLVLLILGTCYEIGSSYLALVWLVSPGIAYGLLESTLNADAQPKPLGLPTILLGLAVPVVLSAGTIIKLMGTVIGYMVRLDRNPGANPEWMGSALIAVTLAAIICLTLAYVLSYFHVSGSGAKKSTVSALCLAFGLSFMLVSSGTIPAFNEVTVRAVHVVHVVDSSTMSGDTLDPTSFVALYSTTPGNLDKEVEHINEGFTCSSDRVIDFVTFQVKYSCVAYEIAEVGWNETRIPTMLPVKKESNGNKRINYIKVNTQGSTRGAIAINMDEVEDFTVTAESGELVPYGDKTSVDGWHIVQFSGGKNATTRFFLTLLRTRAYNAPRQSEDQQPLVKLRTDFNDVTLGAGRVLAKLPPWCSLFGKSTAPFTQSFLASLPVTI